MLSWVYRCVRTYQHISMPINVLVGFEELAMVQYADEQCTASAGLNERLCNLCCSLCCGYDDILLGWKGFFDVGKADMAAHVPTQQVPQLACMRGKGGGQGGQLSTWWR